MYLILFLFGVDIGGTLLGIDSVAFMAHISGSLFGFALGLTLLATRVLAREPYDFLVLVDRWIHPQLRAVDPLEAHTLEVSPHLKAVLAALEGGDESGAVERYAQLVKRHPAAVLPRQSQLDLADHAFRLERYTVAAQAYERFLLHHPQDGYVDQVHLILGLLYASRIHRPDRAKRMLTDALENLEDKRQLKIVNEALARLG
jgi:tetratricopeptide (TPR) repeat protein